MLVVLLAALTGALPVATLDSLMVAVSAPRGGTAAAAVVRLRDDSLVWGHDATRRMLPASTQKVLSAASLRALLGGSRTFPTTLVGTGPAPDSLLRGHIVLAGGGNPAFARGTDSTILDRMTNLLARRGLRRVEGAIVVQDPYLKRADALWPGSWDWDNSLTDCDGAPSAGVSVDGNCPGDSSLAHPHRHAALRLRAALSKSGIAVAGPDSFALGASSPSEHNLLAVSSSPTLDSLLRDALWKSSNHDMETLGLVAGASDSVSTRRAGLARVRADLSGLGLDTTRSDLADLSGLSRKNALSPRSMAFLLARVSRDSARNVIPLLPSPGEGTLRTRFQRTLPPGTRLRAKTGSLDGVSALAGILVPPDGDSLAFALFFQGHAGPATAIRFAQDQIVGILAGGRVVAPTARDTTPPPPKPAKPPRPRSSFLDP